MLRTFRVRGVNEFTVASAWRTKLIEYAKSNQKAFETKSFKKAERRRSLSGAGKAASGVTCYGSGRWGH
jgi:hypothetical protein